MAKQVRKNHGALAQSLLMKRQREVLDRVAERAGTSIVYVKAVWAEPVLYGGLGQRSGCDVDVLVRPARFRAFADELGKAGFRRVHIPGWRFGAAIGKEWLFSSVEGLFDVDLHRQLAEAPWFRLDPDRCMDRSVIYQSVDGPIRSLCPEDQVVYAAIHYAQSLFKLDGRQLEDIRRLIEGYPMDWAEVWRVASAGWVEVPVVLLAAALRATGADVPIDRGWLGPTERLRLRIAEKFVSPTDGLGRRRQLPRLFEYMTLMPALSSRRTAWLRYVGRFSVQRAVDSVDQRLAARAGRRTA